jgi:predicted nuclease of predicted toxin-antitoxin system
MKILIDMNLSPAWVSVLEEAGHTASHWSTIGSLNAPDREVLLWAKANGYVLFTHDLDFGAILNQNTRHLPWPLKEFAPQHPQ